MHVSKIRLGPGSVHAEYVTEFIALSCRATETFLWGELSRAEHQHPPRYIGKVSWMVSLNLR